jgi:predicted DNA-binding transcriptional regulator YafY
VFQEEPFDSLTVRFRAGGMHEMCDRLFTWGLAVTVAEPEELHLSLAELTGAVAVHHGVQRDQP